MKFNSATAICIHIPKTAGTTVQSFVRQICPSEQQYHISPEDLNGNVKRFCELSDSKKNKIKLIRGHVRFGLHHVMPGECRYISCLRDPVERSASAYFHAKRTQGHVHFELIKQSGLSLVDYISKGYVGKNMQTKFISGVPPKDLGKMFEKESRADKELLEIAIKNVNQHFSVIGVVDHLKGFVEKLNKAYGLKIEYEGQRLNVNPNKETDYRTSLSENELGVLLEFNSVDVALYNHIYKMTYGL